MSQLRETLCIVQDNVHFCLRFTPVKFFLLHPQVLKMEDNAVWSRELDEKTGYHYFYNLETGESRWDESEYESERGLSSGDTISLLYSTDTKGEIMKALERKQAKEREAMQQRFADLNPIELQAVVPALTQKPTVQIDTETLRKAQEFFDTNLAKNGALLEKYLLGPPQEPPKATSNAVACGTLIDVEEEVEAFRESMSEQPDETVSLDKIDVAAQQKILDEIREEKRRRRWAEVQAQERAKVKKQAKEQEKIRTEQKPPRARKAQSAHLLQPRFKPDGGA